MATSYEPKSFEFKWQERWKEADLFRTREGDGKPKFYALDFFPYPSGAGLSVGHCRNYIPTDVLCRMKIMQGYNVLHPMGFDAFGLPAENEAIAKKTHPRPMVESYANNYRRQMDLIGISYDWSRSFTSSDPSYYKWTEWIFKLLFERGLAERRMAPVNWDPVEKTVLADEEVIAGRGWRSGALIEKRYIPQWYFRITDYADRLLEDLDELDWPEGIKQQQRNWIGKSTGVDFKLKVDTDADKDLSFHVYTTRIDTAYGITFCVLAPEHPLVTRFIELADLEHVNAMKGYREWVRAESEQDRLATNKDKTGVFTGFYAINPFNGKRIPIWIADYVLMGYGTGAVIGVPAHDERDYEFANKFGLPLALVISPNGDPQYEAPYFDPGKEGIVVNSEQFDGLTVGEALERMADWLEEWGIGKRETHYKLRDWLISRQRYWGCPIPIVYEKDEVPEAVSDEDLPVLLPDVENYEPSGDGSSPLSRIDSFVNATTHDGRKVHRETDTMAGFACSSWYFLRFADPHNNAKAWDFDKVQKWLPVDCYVGGAEHAVMHLLYARFWTKVFYDAGLVPFKEPFKKLMNQGMLLALTPFRKPRSGERLEVGEEGIQISFSEAEILPKDQVFYRWEKMSKSKGNVVTPDEAVDKYGADALRIFELFMAPFDQALQWSEEGMQGSIRFLHRVFRIAEELGKYYQKDWKSKIEDVPSTEASLRVRRYTHQAILKVTEDIERFAFNTYISAMMTYVNNLNDVLRSDYQNTVDEAGLLALSEALEALILLLSPAAPHSADEIWESLGGKGFVYNLTWPIAKPELAKEETITIAIQVSGKLRATVEVSADIEQSELEKMALENERVKAFTEGKTVRKVIVVPGRLVNIVAN